MIQPPAEKASLNSTSPSVGIFSRVSMSIRIDGQSHVFSPHTIGLVSALYALTVAPGAELWTVSPEPSSSFRRSSSACFPTATGKCPEAIQAAASAFPWRLRSSSLAWMSARRARTISAAGRFSSFGSRTTGAGSAMFISQAFSAVLFR